MSTDAAVQTLPNDGPVLAGHIDFRTDRRARLRDYIAIARLDHATKHVFIIPGIVLAYALRGARAEDMALNALLGFASAFLIASANYVINEYLDRETDRHHPTKSGRTALQVDFSPGLIFLEWACLVLAGLVCAAISSKTMLLVATLFVAQGIVYNVRPFRSKDRAYLDVISESVNNPLRLLIGWSIVDPTTLPPSSVVLAYWAGGAFLMAAKRFSEYREITSLHGRDLLVRYRASFAHYSEVSLNVSCLIYASVSSFFLGVFLIKYRIEYLLTFPAFAFLFGTYLALSMQHGSVAQKPEKLFREKSLVGAVVALVLLLGICSFVEIEPLHRFIAQDYVELR